MINCKFFSIITLKLLTFKIKPQQEKHHLKKFSFYISQTLQKFSSPIATTDTYTETKVQERNHIFIFIPDSTMGNLVKQRCTRHKNSEGLTQNNHPFGKLARQCSLTCS